MGGNKGRGKIGGSVPSFAIVEKVCPQCGKKAMIESRAKYCGKACQYAALRSRGTGAKTVSALDELVLSAARKKGATISSIADALDRGPRVIRESLAGLKERGYNLEIADGAVSLEPVQPKPPSTPSIVHDMREYAGKWKTFGITSDNHLCNKHARLDVLKALYSRFADEGITEVWNAGNWIDGEFSKNKHELLVRGLDPQVQYWAENWPQHRGMKTLFVAGDDHEGWYQQRECIEIGRHAQMVAERGGRNDLIYMGYGEALIELKGKGGSARGLLCHPGGGAPYAISYSGQKVVEAFQGGEKPQFVIQGHYHKANYSYPREVHVIDAGTTCDQTFFMRKKRIAAHVGGWIVEFKQGDDGRILEFRCRWLPFYDRGFYGDSRRNFSIPGVAA